MIYRFGPFELDPQKRLLHKTGTAISLTPKAFELLIVLIENRGRLMTKDELMQKVWPDSFVEEGNLTQTISVLRKALGDSQDGVRNIVTLPGRGYQFVGAVAEVSGTGPLLSRRSKPARSRRITGKAVSAPH